MTTGVEWIEEGLPRVNEEVSLIRQELSAWRSFREEVKLSQPARDTATSDAETKFGGGTPPEILREQYKKIVMATSDYDEQYGDTVSESLEAEFNEIIRQALCVKDQLRPQIRRTLLVATSERIECRKQYMELLKSEGESLQDAANKLTNVESRLSSIHPPTDSTASIETRIGSWTALEDLESQCQRIIDERLMFLDDELRTNLEGDVINLEAYLYGDIGTPHPVLRAVADDLEQIEEYRVRTPRSELPC